MKTQHTIGAIIACMGLSLYLRIALPYNVVFSGEWVKFIGNDAYWQMGQVAGFAPDFPAYFTQIADIPFFIWLLSGVAWCVGLGSPTQHTIDVVGAYYPAVLAALTILPVYFIGKVVFNRMAGIVAAVLIAILPGEWLGRSLLGFTDHHVMEVLLSTTVIMFFVFVLKDVATNRKRIICGLLFVVCIGIYTITWKGAVFSALSSVVSLSWPPALSGISALTTAELQPFFYPFGVFTLAVGQASFGFIFLIIPVALGILIYQAIRTGDKGIILLVIWSLTIMTMMLLHRRFAYYFAINAALIGGWFAWYVWQYFNKKSVAYALIAMVVLLPAMTIPNLQASVALASNTNFVPSNAWCSTLTWVKDNTPRDSVVLAWWDYGYWIEYEAQRKAYVDPSQSATGVKQTSNFLLSRQGSGLDIAADYIILDYATVNYKREAMLISAGCEIADFSKCLMTRLYSGEDVSGYDLVYESEEKIDGTSEVKVFRKGKEATK